MRCKTCHYSLQNLTEHRCPECGTAFDADDLAKSNLADQSRARWRAFAWLIGTFLLSALAVVIVVESMGWPMRGDDLCAVLGISLLITALVSPLILLQLRMSLRKGT